MASNYTEHYNLCQWEATDQVLRTDFNEDNAKVDAALESLKQTAADHAEALAQCGNCKIVYGSYTGNGTYGENNPTRLEFDHKPLIVAIMMEDTRGQSVIIGFWALRGSNFLYTSEYFNSRVTLLWEARALAWISSDENYQYNASGTVYHYVALLSMDE